MKWHKPHSPETSWPRKPSTLVQTRRLKHREEAHLRSKGRFEVISALGFLMLRVISLYISPITPQPTSVGFHSKACYENVTVALMHRMTGPSAVTHLLIIHHSSNQYLYWANGNKRVAAILFKEVTGWGWREENLEEGKGWFLASQQRKWPSKQM